MMLENRKIKGLVLAATKSGSGKTTVTLGLLSALAKRGYTVAPFKVGPDFIDPGHHSMITGGTCRNLDGWMLSKETNLDCFASNSFRADIAVVEGVMGLFDGYDGKSEAGSTAQMAKWLNLPVLLIVDAKRMARSAAALVQGFEGFDPDLELVGVVFNNIGSSRHLEYLKEALENTVKTPCLGGIVNHPDVSIPERHLGLYTQEDHPMSNGKKSRLVSLVEENIDVESLIHSLPEVQISALSQKPGSRLNGENVRIGVAKDNAFCFYYADNFDLLEENGADLVFFSPLKDENLPEDLDGLYLGGGYPELFAGQLSDNRNVREQIHEQSRKGLPVYAECGGFMYLSEALIDTEGERFPMAGIFPLETRMHTRLKALGYREITLLNDTVIGNQGFKIRGHEFHYSELCSNPDEIKTTYRVSTRAGLERETEGFQINRCLGSYIHLHFGSCPEAARKLVDNCRKYRYERTGRQ